MTDLFASWCPSLKSYTLQIDISGWATPPSWEEIIDVPNDIINGIQDILLKSPWIIIGLLAFLLLIIILILRCIRATCFGVSCHILGCCCGINKCRCRCNCIGISINGPRHFVFFVFVCIIALAAIALGIVTAETAQENIIRVGCVLNDMLSSTIRSFSLMKRTDTITLPPKDKIEDFYDRNASLEKLTKDASEIIWSVIHMNAHPFTYADDKKLRDTILEATESVNHAWAIHRAVEVLKKVKMEESHLLVRSRVIGKISEGLFDKMAPYDFSLIWNFLRMDYVIQATQMWTIVMIGLTPGLVFTIICVHFLTKKDNNATDVEISSEPKAPQVKIHDITVMNKPPRHTKTLRRAGVCWLILYFEMMLLTIVGFALILLQHGFSMGCDQFISIADGSAFSSLNIPHSNGLKRCMVRNDTDITPRTFAESLESEIFGDTDIIGGTLDLRKLLVTEKKRANPIIFEEFALPDESNFIFLCGSQVYKFTALPTVEQQEKDCDFKKFKSRWHQQQQADKTLLSFQFQLYTLHDRFQRFAHLMNAYQENLVKVMPKLVGKTSEKVEYWAGSLKCPELQRRVEDTINVLCRKGSMRSMLLLGGLLFWIIGGCLWYFSNLAYGVWREERKPLEKWWLQCSQEGFRYAMNSTYPMGDAGKGITIHVQSKEHAHDENGDTQSSASTITGGDDSMPSVRRADMPKGFQFGIPRYGKMITPRTVTPSATPRTPKEVPPLDIEHMVMF